MTEHDLQTKGIRLVGYGALIARFHLEVIPNWHHSFVATGNARRTDTTAGMTKEVYPARYWPGDTLGDHLEFALKYDGTNLAILASVFSAAPVEEVRQYVASAPRGKYARRLRTSATRAVCSTCRTASSIRVSGTPIIEPNRITWERLSGPQD
jgi:hypothetical protein